MDFFSFSFWLAFAITLSRAELVQILAILILRIESTFSPWMVSHVGYISN